MRVLVVTSEWPTVEQPTAKPFVVQQVAALRRRGIDVDVVPMLGARSPANYVRARRAVRARLAARTYDLVHVHFGQCALAVMPSKVPLVVTFHGSDLVGVVGDAGRYTAAGRLLSRWSRLVARRARAVIVVADRLAGLLPRRVAYDVIPCGIELDVFRPGDKASARSALGLPPEGRIVLFSGDPKVVRKRHPLAQQAVALVDGALLLHVVGEPPEVVRTYMNAADVLLVTARHEAAPVMVKEALAADLPVVSLDVGDVREWIGDLAPCQVCDDDDPRTIATALRRALSYEGAFDGRSRVEPVDNARIAERLEELYRRVLADERQEARYA